MKQPNTTGEFKMFDPNSLTSVEALVAAIRSIKSGAVEDFLNIDIDENAIERENEIGSDFVDLSSLFDCGVE